MKILYTGVVWMLTLTVCSLHIGFITQQYLLYETTTKMTIRHEDTIDIPVVVVCMSSGWTGDNVSDYFVYQHRRDNETLQKFHMMASGCGKELKKVCDTGHGLPFFILTGHQNISNIFSVIQFVKSRHRCFAFRMRQRLFHASLAASTISYLIYDLKFHRGEKTPSDLRYFLVHPEQKVPFVDDRNELAFYFHRDKDVKNVRSPVACLNYQRRETRLLESPYDTRCLNYSTMGLQSQLHCLNDCILRSASRSFEYSS